MNGFSAVGDVVVLQRAPLDPSVRQTPENVLPPSFGNRVHAHAAERVLRRLRSGVVDQLGLRQLVHGDAVALTAGARQVLADVHAVEKDVLVGGRRSVDRHRADEALAVEAHPGHQRRAALHRPRGGQDVEHLAVEDRLVLRALRVDDRRRAGDGHRLFDRADRQRSVDLRRERAFEHDAFALHRSKPGQRERHGVGAGTKIDDGVAARAVGHRAPHLFDQRGARRLDGHAGHHGARRILHDADDAGALLGGCGCWKQKYGHARDPEGQDESTHDVSSGVVIQKR